MASALGDGSIELVIFDCDGVLIDSEPISNRVLAQTLTDHGFPTTYDESVRDYQGYSSAVFLQLVVRKWGRSTPPGFMNIFQARVFAAFERELRAVEGVAEVVQGLAVPICVASSSGQDRIRLGLELTGLWPHFAGHTFSAREVERGKPFPDLFLHACRTMRATADRCIVIEDSVPGVRAGVAAGMRVLGFAERSEPAALAAAGATVFRHMRELPPLLASLGA